MHRTSTNAAVLIAAATCGLMANPVMAPTVLPAQPVRPAAGTGK